MARGVNKVILIGNLGKDPETRYLPSGGAVTSLTLATSETWKDKQTGQPQERTEWHRVVCFNRLAEIAAEYLKKGSKVYIEGSLRTRKWQDQQGQDRYTTEIVAGAIQMLDGRPGQGDSASSYGQHAQAQQPAGTRPPPANQPMGAHQAGQTPPGQGSGFDNFDDDIPF